MILFDGAEKGLVSARNHIVNVSLLTFVPVSRYQLNPALSVDGDTAISSEETCLLWGLSGKTASYNARAGDCRAFKGATHNMVNITDASTFVKFIGTSSNSCFLCIPDHTTKGHRKVPEFYVCFYICQRVYIHSNIK